MASHWRPILIAPNRRMSAELAPLFSVHMPLAPVRDLTEYPARADVAKEVTAGRFNICLLDATTDQERALQLISEIQSAASGLPIVVLLTSSDPDFLLQCLRCGAGEFLSQPFTGDQMVAMLEKVLKLLPAGAMSDHGSGKVVCVMPAKGACGASTLAANLAFHFRRLGAKRTLLADLDPLAGTLSFLLKAKSSYSFLDVLTRQGNLDGDIWKGLVTASGGVDVLLSPENPVHGFADVQDSSMLVDYIRSAYDAAVLDAGGAYGAWNVSMARASDEVLVVTTNELPALQAAQRTLLYLENHRVSRARVKLVVNRHTRDMGLSREAISSALRAEVVQVIPSDYETVQKSLMEGKPIPVTTPFGKALAGLAERVMGPTKKATKSKEPSGGLAGLLKKWF